jgi:hypothetical protein
MKKDSDSQSTALSKSVSTNLPDTNSEWWMLPVEELPHPTYWPITMSLGIVFAFWGIVTSFIISGVGIILFIIALIGWLGDLRNAE